MNDSSDSTGPSAQSSDAAASPASSAAPSMAEVALAYARAGFHVIVLHSISSGSCSCGKANCKSPGKHPRSRHGLKDATTDPAIIRQGWSRWPDANIGLVTGQKSGLYVLDIDGADGRASLTALVEAHGQLPATPWVRTGRGAHMYYAAPASGAKVASRTHIMPGLDIRGEGGYVVAPPSTHANGSIYTWSAKTAHLKLAPLPACLGARGEPETGRADQAGTPAPQVTLDQAAASVASRPAYTDAEVARIRSALAVVPADDRETWFKVGAALHWLSEGGGWDSEVTRATWDWWSRTYDDKDDKKYDEDEQETTWESYDRGYDGVPITLGTLFHIAKAHGWTPTADEQDETDETDET